MLKCDFMTILLLVYALFSFIMSYLWKKNSYRQLVEGLLNVLMSKCICVIRLVTKNFIYIFQYFLLGFKIM